MKENYRIFFVSLVLVTFFFLLWGGLSETMAAEKIVLKFAPGQYGDHPYHKMAVKFKEELEKRNNKVVVNIFPGVQLGSERDLFESLQLGTVEIGSITSAITARFVPGFKVFSLPFLFKDYNHLFRVMDSDIGERLAGDLEKAGVIKLSYAYGGTRDLYSNMPIRNLEELKGKKIRTMEDKILVATWNTLGALATPMPWGDLPLGLKQGVVDGAEGTGATYRSYKLFENSPHFTRIVYVFLWKNIMMSKKTWDKLPDDVRSDVMAASKVAEEYERKLFVETENTLFAELQKKYGVTLYNPADLEEWRKQAAAVYEKHAKELGGMDYIREIQSK